VRIVHAASELAPWCGTGGLGEVLGALPPAQAEQGGREVDVSVFCPLYRSVRQEVARRGAELVEGPHFDVAIDGRRIPGIAWELTDSSPVRTVFLDAPELFDRDGLYDEQPGRWWADNPLRFGWFCKAVLAAAPRVLGEEPDLLHAHDWQTAMLPLILRTHAELSMPSAASVFTIHNIEYQGIFDKEWIDRIGLSWELYHLECLEYWGRLNLLKGGVCFAGLTTTVSRRYAREVTTLPFGAGLHEFLRQRPRRLRGILNGLDIDAWDPRNDPQVAARFSDEDLAGKAACRVALLSEFGLEAKAGEPVLGVVSRFVHHKGLDLVAELVPELERLGARLVVLGSGDPELEQRFRRLQLEWPERLAVRVGWDEGLARRLYAGADLFLMPSRSEPCGLSQMQAMRYGAVPVVHATGGLADTITDPGNPALARGEGRGFRFEWPDLAGLRWALERAIRLYRDDPEGWGRVVRVDMTADFSWGPSARRYLDLYREVIAERRDEL
jgi:starch synthase